MKFLDKMYEETPRKFKRAANELIASFGVVSNNEKINRREGDIRMAESERKTGDSIKKAISLMAQHGDLITKKRK